MGFFNGLIGEGNQIRNEAFRRYSEGNEPGGAE